MADAVFFHIHGVHICHSHEHEHDGVADLVEYGDHGQHHRHMGKLGAGECETFHQDLNGQQAQRSAFDAQRRTQLEAAQERQREADERARALLLSYLNESQRAEFAVHHSFRVCGKSGRHYRIRRGPSMSGNVDVLYPDGSVGDRLCAHDRHHGTPVDDQLLAQKFYLEHHEAEFLAVANRH